MSNPQGNISPLPLNAMSVIPNPKPGARHVTALKKESGRVTGYQLSDGLIVDKPEGVRLAKDGEIAGVGVSKRNGNEYLKSLPDQTEGNNLGHLPTVH
jgi:hypothetical protein